ncbi:MAG: hypothetical protein DRO18_06440 [Thermoprotei archaeon]|nr:MAG: hypothetical protein DRO18_06440 [Thermoprotei archaeon]
MFWFRGGGFGWRGGRGGWGRWSPWPGRGPFSHLPPWMRPGWLFGRGSCWFLFGWPWGLRWYYPFWYPYYWLPTPYYWWFTPSWYPWWYSPYMTYGWWW